jgi:hypothetical protein
MNGNQSGGGGLLGGLGGQGGFRFGSSAPSAGGSFYGTGQYYGMPGLRDLQALAPQQPQQPQQPTPDPNAWVPKWQRKLQGDPQQPPMGGGQPQSWQQALQQLRGQYGGMPAWNVWAPPQWNSPYGVIPYQPRPSNNPQQLKDDAAKAKEAFRSLKGYFT